MIQEHRLHPSHLWLQHPHPWLPRSWRLPEADKQRESNMEGLRWRLLGSGLMSRCDAPWWLTTRWATPKAQATPSCKGSWETACIWVHKRKENGIARGKGFSYFTKFLERLEAWQPVKVKVAQLCLTLCDPMDYTVLGILQARILEWVAFPSSRGPSQPRDQSQVSRIAGRFFTSWAKGKPKNTGVGSLFLPQGIFLI